MTFFFSWIRKKVTYYFIKKGEKQEREGSSVHPHRFLLIRMQLFSTGSSIKGARQLSFGIKQKKKKEERNKQRLLSLFEQQSMETALHFTGTIKISTSTNYLTYLDLPVCCQFHPIMLTALITNAKASFYSQVKITSLQTNSKIDSNRNSFMFSRP